MYHVEGFRAVNLDRIVKDQKGKHLFEQSYHIIRTLTRSKRARKKPKRILQSFRALWKYIYVRIDKLAMLSFTNVVCNEQKHAKGTQHIEI